MSNVATDIAIRPPIVASHVEDPAESPKRKAATIFLTKRSFNLGPKNSLGYNGGSLRLSAVAPAAFNKGESSKDISDSKHSVSDTNMSEPVLMSVIVDPIQCGYLLAFCDSEHNAENLNFVVDVFLYQDMFVVDKNIWRKSWRLIDHTLATVDQPFQWPSKILEIKAVQEKINEIWMKYIADTADLQICTSAKVFQNTKRRVERVDLYGPEVFGEALLDPISTLRRDTIPRFLRSDECTEMIVQIEALKSLPQAQSLMVPPPYKSPSQSEFLINPKGGFGLDEVLLDQFLYTEFLTYLTSHVSSENLLCLRMIQIFEEMGTDHLSRVDSKVKKHAWTIYRYFVASGSPYEVSLSSHHKKQLELALARPVTGMFSELYKSAYRILNAEFESFKTTPAYATLKDNLAIEFRRSKVTWTERILKILGCWSE